MALLLPVASLRLISARNFDERLNASELRNDVFGVVVDDATAVVAEGGGALVVVVVVLVVA